MPCLCAEAGWFLPQRFNHDLEPFPDKGYLVKRAALYLRVSTVDQHPETQGSSCASSLSSAATRFSVNTLTMV
jgi:hypothetical protein